MEDSPLPQSSLFLSLQHQVRKFCMFWSCHLQGILSYLHTPLTGQLSHLHILVQIRVCSSRLYRHWARQLLVVGFILYIVKYWAVSSASTHWMPVVSHHQQCPQTVPKCILAAIRNVCLNIRFFNRYSIVSQLQSSVVFLNFHNCLLLSFFSFSHLESQIDSDLPSMFLCSTISPLDALNCFIQFCNTSMEHSSWPKRYSRNMHCTRTCYVNDSWACKCLLKGERVIWHKIKSMDFGASMLQLPNSVLY